MRQLGGAVGLALLASMLLDRSQYHWQELATHVNPARPEVQAMMERLQDRAGALVGVDPEAYAARRLTGMVAREAAVMSFADAFFAISLSFFAIAILLLFVSKPQPTGPVAGRPGPSPQGGRR
jgi:DHA2 family multidrug resistance protein